MSRTNFKQLKIGDTFHTGIAKGIGIHANKIKYMLYRKNSISSAVIIEMIGYENRRYIGDVKKFSYMSGVYPYHAK